MATTNVWAEDCTYTLSDIPSKVNVVQTGSLGLIKYHNFPNTTLCTLTNSYGISKISFNMRKDGGTNNGDFKLQCYNGSSWEDAKDASNNSITWNVKNSNTATVSREINPSSTTGKASKFQIVRTSNTNFTSSSRYFTISNIVVVMAKTLSGSEETMPFDDQVYNTTSSAKTRDFTFSNVATGKSISITNNTNATEFPAEIAKDDDDDCTGSVTVSVKFKPSQKGTRTGQITVSGDCGSKTFTVTGNGLLATPTLILKGITGLVDRTADVAKPNYIDLSVFFDTYIGDGYKYEVVSSNSQYAHFVGDNFYATEKGEYTIHITSPAGEHYSDTFADGKKYREIVITVRDKARPVYNANYTQSSADGMLVDGIIENAYTLTNVSNDAYFACNISVTSISDVNDGSGRVISYDAKTNKIIAHNAGTATLQFVQTENNDYYGEESPTYTFTVSKHQTSFGGEAYSMMVEGTQIANYSYTNTSSVQPTALSADDFYYTIDNVVFANEELNKGTDLITFNPSTKQITACNAGTAKITLHQKETYKYTGATASYNVTVNKYTPTFTWNAANATYYYGTSIPNIFSTTNPDVEPILTSDNEAFARVENNTLYIANARETATITVEQKENYKWNVQTRTYTITPVKENNHVEFTYTQAMFNDGTITTQKVSQYGVEWTSDNQLRLGGSSKNVLPGYPAYDWDDKYIVIHFEGIPKDISFKYKANTSDVSNGATALKRADWYIAEGSEGPNGEIMWSENYPWKNLGGDKSNSTDWVTVSNQPLQSSTRYLKLCYSGNFAGYYSDIIVTERFQFEATPTAIDFGSEGITYGMQHDTVIFLHANAGRITKAVITGADAKNFNVTPELIPGTGRDCYGNAALEVTFDNLGEDRGATPYNATLVISDNSDKTEDIHIPLTGIRDGKSTADIIWNPNALPYYFNTTIANIAYSTNRDANCPLTFATTDNTIAEVKNGDLHIYNKGQEVTITVTQLGNADFMPAIESFTFTPCERPNLEAPFLVSQALHANSVQLGTKSGWYQTDNQIRIASTSFGDGFIWGDDRKRVLITFAGTPDKLYFEYSSSDAATPELATYGWEVEESANGTDWNTVWKTGSLSASWKTSGEIDLSPNTQYIRFSYKGNFAGYLRNIIISSLEGNSYLRAEEGSYLSRGAKWGTQAVVDPFGMVCRVSHFTVDNTNIYTRLQFVDNMQYLYETADTKEVFTDAEHANNSAYLWQINSDASGKFTIQSANDLGNGNRGNYFTLIDNTLSFTSDPTQATVWHMETPAEHNNVVRSYMDAAAAKAAEKDFGTDINTLEKVRSSIVTQDFAITEIAIPEVTLAEQAGVYRDDINGTFDVYDNTISGLKPGFYRLTVKALYRISDSQKAQTAKANNWESVLAYVYANDVKYPIQSVYTSYNASSYDASDEIYDGHSYPTKLIPSVERAFNQDVNRYLNDVYVYVEADPGQTTGTLRYGIKNPSYVPGAWLAYGKITLTHFGRKEYVFIGSDPEKPTDWFTPENWSQGSVPKDYHTVRIGADVNITTPINIHGIVVDENKTLHITSTGGLTVGNTGVVSAATGTITIDNTPEGAGFLKVDPTTDKKPAKVTINYITEAYNSGNPRDEIWQYMGAPGNDMQMSDADKTMIYHWNEQQGWLKMSNTNLQPFVGYAFTQNKEQEASFEIQATPIIPDKPQEITLTLTQNGMRGSNLFVNSFLAPIDLATFDDEDFTDGVEQTFYLYNSGSWKDWQSQGGKDHMEYGTSPGQYFALTPGSAALVDASLDQTTIPSMQGVYVIAREDGAKIKLDYAKHVYAANASNTPMRAPERTSEDFKRVRLQVNSPNSGADRMYVIQHEVGTTGYDNGYDARNMAVASQVSIYTTEAEGQMEISVSDNIDSTYIGFNAGADSEYTLHMTSVVGEMLYLKDLQNQTLISVGDGVEYRFTAEPNSVNDKRFLLLDQRSNGVTTDQPEVQVYVHDKIAHIVAAPEGSDMVVYSIGGTAIANYVLGVAPCVVDLSELPVGVYVLRVNDKAFKCVCR